MKNEQQSEYNGCLVLPLTHSNRGLDSLSLEQIAALPDAQRLEQDGKAICHSYRLSPL
ncbi:TPA: hypothetical protein RFU61_001762 [Klebsiella pneumoniae subsp. pneumoniae]|nr:hypothetical protein [Klebsiella pneumoniae subsp. pneumoniae]